MKQDNRPSKSGDDYKISALKELLDDVPSAPADDFQDKSPPTKIVIVSVNGNNNNVATEKTRQFISNTAGKSCFIFGAVVLTLFF